MRTSPQIRGIIAYLQVRHKLPEDMSTIVLQMMDMYYDAKRDRYAQRLPRELVRHIAITRPRNKLYLPLRFWTSPPSPSFRSFARSFARQGHAVIHSNGEITLPVTSMTYNPNPFPWLQPQQIPRPIRIQPKKTPRKPQVVETIRQQKAANRAQQRGSRRSGMR